MKAGWRRWRGFYLGPFVQFASEFSWTLCTSPTPHPLTVLQPQSFVFHPCHPTYNISLSPRCSQDQSKHRGA
ncbi:hypothetical protein B0T20DRAFT_416839 [Sordaria brevicollis]|uniref:Uncharacterized protein n=1 Tax=Sordaria brevicollis TaxID=83679 RepID=A0AAE0PAA8_SORBR|nr:hypothetical protein B0T20DRAFT_416839 [Sordaria brevicollis]